MVAFTLSVIIAVILTGLVVVYTDRRPADAPTTWGEAMVGAVYVFFILFWVYGVVPHQWLSWSDNELNWRADKLFVGPGGILEAQPQGGWNPITINYVHIRDLIVVVIYGIGLGGHIAMWSRWQNRGKRAAAPETRRSAFGRPLVREGVDA